MANPTKMQLKWLKTHQLQSVVIAGIFVFFLAQFVLLSPSTLEEDFNGFRVVHPENLLNFLKNEATTLPAVPKTPPSYSLRTIQYFSTDGTKPSFRLLARKSNVYQEEQLVHGKELILFLPDGTRVESDEGVYFTEVNRGELYGNVKAFFKDGTVIRSDFALILSEPYTQIMVPIKYPVSGEKIKGGSPIFFKGNGLKYTESDPPLMNLLSQVDVEIHGSKLTRVKSDQAIFNQKSDHLRFFMNDNQAIDQQFVKVHQIDMDMKSRILDVNMDEKQNLKTLVGVKDVYIHDYHDPAHPSQSTSGKATYFQDINEIHLDEFPQVYQDGDTIIGDRIIFNRTRDTIEVKQSNAIYRQKLEQ